MDTRWKITGSLDKPVNKLFLWYENFQDTDIWLNWFDQICMVNKSLKLHSLETRCFTDYVSFYKRESWAFIKGWKVLDFWQSLFFTKLFL